MYSKLAGLILLLAAMFRGNGQGLVNGRVADQQATPLAGVAVHLLNTQVNEHTDRNGNFSIKNLRPGNYTIELTAAGYATLSREVSVAAAAPTSLSFQLQSTMVQLEAVTVTAQKREESLQKIPVTVSALSARQVQEFRLWNIKELTAIVPNLYSGNSGDERNVTSIRGITTTSYDPSVATYIDGVNQFSLDTYIPQLSDVERIEVLRGPQGTLYGRNAMGGVINIITKQPTNATSGFAELNFGNYNQQRYSAGLRTPIVKDKLFFGASGVFNKRDGYYKNLFNNESFDRQKNITGNYYLKYLPAAGWGITLNMKHQLNRNYGAFPMVNGADEAFAHPFELNQNAIARMVDNSFNTSLSVNHSGKSVDFSSQLAWQNNHRYYESPLDGDFSPLDAVTVINNYGSNWNNVKVLTHELRFSSPSANASRLSWTGGTYFFHQYIPGKQATHFGKDAALLGLPDIDFSTISTTKGKNTGVAAYGQVNYSITKNFAVIAGMRFDYEHKKLSVKGEYQKDGQDAFVTTADTSAAAHFSALSPKVGLKYQLAANSNLYANYSRGYRTGGLTQLAPDPSQPPLYPYDPEYSNNVELGIKNSLLDDRLRLNISAFLTRVTNAQVPTLVLPQAITVTRNTGALTSKGAELELSFAPVKGFQLEYSFGYTDAKYKSLKIASGGQEVDLKGKKQIFTPDVTSMLVLQYSYLLSARQQLRLVARGEWYYLGERYFDLANTIRQSPYNTFNSRVGLSSRYLELFFWARNMSNRNYIEYAYDFGAVHFGSPKTYGLTLRAML
jgi:iron complex outermembrane receptor protein